MLRCKCARVRVKGGSRLSFATNMVSKDQFTLFFCDYDDHGHTRKV